MATVPARKPIETIEEKFSRLAVRWKSETGFLSSTAKMAEHPAYQEIISMGDEVVPFILRELETKPDHWFKALRAITGAQPVPAADSGNVPAMAKAWLSWGRKHGYQW
jgi:hypothetical protein